MNRTDLEARGYRFDTLGECRGSRCRQEIAWYWTPQKAHLPFDLDGTPHWATCVDAAEFRRPRETGRRTR